MCDWEYKYHECDDLEFYIQCDNGIDDELMFDVDYKGEFLILDLGDTLEVEI